MSDAPVTILLQKWQKGDAKAGEAFAEAVYADLKRLAGHYLRGEGNAQTLSPTILVNELFLKLIGGAPVGAESRAHFFAVGARQLRRILIDHARAKSRLKREFTKNQTLSDGILPGSLPKSEDLIAVDDALTNLGAVDARAAQVVELRYFAGLTDEETAKTLGTSVASVKRDWAFARAWLLKELS